ncbi:unnamed protein product [Commensalibacter communis]|uniref:DUF4089 domain-containing protein n=1 Tax=Commensalibacter communis TaxID=2972786 RepID=UPI0022FF9442|nr:DUF4089 domain-containing protein [Commensalibacter communis]CAI3940807.1 unnamed protein product [Commensalibacter communis]
MNNFSAEFIDKLSKMINLKIPQEAFKGVQHNLQFLEDYSKIIQECDLNQPKTEEPNI